METQKCRCLLVVHTGKQELALGIGKERMNPNKLLSFLFLGLKREATQRKGGRLIGE